MRVRVAPKSRVRNKCKWQNHAKALFNLGICCEKGKGLDHNPNDAQLYYRRAAELSHPGAQ